MSTTDRIEKRVTLRAPRARVWRALSTAAEFGTWFGVRFDGDFAAGRAIHGRITTPPGYEHVDWQIVVDRIEPEHLFSFRWRPYAIDPAVDYSGEPMTLCTFELADHEGGTLLTFSESGFDGIPAARRDTAFRMNDGGWTAQVANLARHVAA